MRWTRTMKLLLGFVATAVVIVVVGGGLVLRCRDRLPMPVQHTVDLSMLRAYDSTAWNVASRVRQAAVATLIIPPPFQPGSSRAGGAVRTAGRATLSGRCRG
jgi:hypothetical protein